MTEPRWLDPSEARAWRGYQRMRVLLAARLARQLSDDAGLSDADYTVLSNLSEAEGRRWRLTELADRMGWSRSRLSHHLTRMEQRALVTREDCDEDGRGVDVLLTAAGWDAIVAAAPGHVAAVREHFIDRLTREQLTVLGDIADTVVAHLTRD